MLCSEIELGLGDGADGIMELPSDAPTGEDLRDYLELDDTVIDVDLTPNRGDCFSILGIARETAVKSGKTLKWPELPAVEPEIDTTFPIDVEAPEVGAPRRSMSLLQAYELAKSSEQKAYDFYDWALGNITDPDVRTLFVELRDEETEHVRMIEAEIAKLDDADKDDADSDDGDGPGDGTVTRLQEKIAAIRERLRYSNPPPALRGLGITFMVVGLMSMAFMIFAVILL